MLNSNMALGVNFYKVLNPFVGNPLISTLAIAKLCQVRTAIVIRSFWIFVLMHTNVCETLLGFWCDCSSRCTKSHRVFSLGGATKREGVLFNKARVAFFGVLNLTCPGYTCDSV